jgi:hypothetical protein
MGPADLQGEGTSGSDPRGGSRVERPGSEPGFVPTTARVTVGRSPCPSPRGLASCARTAGAVLAWATLRLATLAEEACMKGARFEPCARIEPFEFVGLSRIDLRGAACHTCMESLKESPP